MKAIVQLRYGSPHDLMLREVATPVAGPGEVVVRVKATSVHPDVWHVVSGRPWVLRLMGAGMVRPRNPIPGTDVAGTVETIGDGVTRFRPGDPVFGETIPAQQWVHGGAWAELVAVPQHLLAIKPANVTFAQAASVPTSGYIVLLNLRELDRLAAGKHVLINGAGGGVGLLVLQLAKAHGARVTAVDSAGKLEMLRALGADTILDFRREDFTRLGTRYDLIVDIPGDRPFRDLRRALKPDGRYIPIGHDDYGRAGRRVFGLIPHFLKLMLLARFLPQLRGPHAAALTKADAIAALRDYLAAGTIRPIIDRTYPLGEAREAMRHVMEDETLGKVILTPGLEKPAG